MLRNLSLSHPLPHFINLSFSFSVSLSLSASARFHVFDLSWQPLTAVNRTLWPQLPGAASAGLSWAALRLASSPFADFPRCAFHFLCTTKLCHMTGEFRRESESESGTGTAPRKRWAIGKCKLPACVALSTSLRQRQRQWQHRVINIKAVFCCSCRCCCWWNCAPRFRNEEINVAKCVGVGVDVADKLPSFPPCGW